MPTFNDYGIILNSYDLAEEDKILNIYTKVNGLVRAIAKGVRKSNSKLGARVDQLSCCYFKFAKGRNLDLVAECEQVNSFPKLRSSLSNLTYAVLFLEIVINFSHEQESESNEVYELLYHSLDELQNTSCPELLSVYFIREFLSIHGLEPQLKTCVSCSKKISVQDLYPYSSILGGFLCSECSKLIDNELIEKNALRVLTETSKESKVNGNVHKALELLREHVNHRAKNKIKSFELVFSL